MNESSVGAARAVETMSKVSSQTRHVVRIIMMILRERRGVAARNSSEVDEMARVLRSVNNALAVLESFSVERPEIGVTELSQTLGLGKSTVHRLLTSLASEPHAGDQGDRPSRRPGRVGGRVHRQDGKRPSISDVLPYRPSGTTPLYGVGEGAGGLGGRGLARALPASPPARLYVFDPDRAGSVSPGASEDPLGPLRVRR